MKPKPYILFFKSIEEIPNEKFKYMHKKYWEYIAENHLSVKPPIIPSITSGCFACAYAHRVREQGHHNRCSYCPLKAFRSNNLVYSIDIDRSFFGNTMGCLNEESLYERWKNEIDQDKKDALALEIANLEWEDLP